jgi:hypothetical protein
VPWMELELELDDFEVEEVDEAHFPPSPVPNPQKCELEDEEEAGEEVVLALVVLLALLAGAEAGAVHGLVGTAMVTTYPQMSV